MKTRNLTTLIIFLVISNCNTSFAQTYYSIKNDLAGFYLTYDDFINGKITNGVPTNKREYILYPQGGFKHKDPELKTPDTTIVYKRSEIWGFNDHRGQLIRVYEDRHYKVLCDKGIVLYIIYSPTSASYHFSKSLNEPVYRLTRKNLNTVYADNKVLLEKIKLSKKKEWTIKNEQAEMFGLNEIFMYK